MSKTHILTALRDKKSDFEAQEKSVSDSFASGSISFDDYLEQYRNAWTMINKYNIIIQKIA